MYALIAVGLINSRLVNGVVINIYSSY